jgi:glycosyltransferase involved in cell wall biosynthesis
MKKLIGFENNGGRLHSYFRSLMSSPPTGYTFDTRNNVYDFLLSPFVQSDFVFFRIVSPILRHSGGRGELRLPVNLWYRRLPGAGITITSRHCDLLYSWNHLTSNKIPWVLDHEYLFALTGYNVEAAWRNLGVIEKKLTDPMCRSILCPTELARDILVNSFGLKSLLSKTCVVNRAVPVRKSPSERNEPVLRMLFLGTRNEPGAFHTKGGKEAIEAFRLVRKKHRVSLVVRSDLPPLLRKYYSGVDGLEIEEKVLPPSRMNQLMTESHVLLLPSHSTPTAAFIDALSYGLPVITTDEMANGEIVNEGSTGKVVKGPKTVPTLQEMIRKPQRVREWESAVMDLQWDTVESLAQAIEFLIENPRERIVMGQNGKASVANGRFSIPRRNSKLKEVFDRAVN